MQSGNRKINKEKEERSGKWKYISATLDKSIRVSI